MEEFAVRGLRLKPQQTDNSPTTVMRIRISDSAYLDELADDLLHGDCVATPVAVDALDVVHPYASDRREALTELRFFVRAWQARRPGVHIQVN
jgi:hypothetical protein